MIIIALVALLTGGAAVLFMSDYIGKRCATPRVSYDFPGSLASKTCDLTPFQKAILERNAEAVRRCLDRGEDLENCINITYLLHCKLDDDDMYLAIAYYTPLHLATLAGDPDIVEMLLKHGAHTESRIPPYGSTPLMNAALFGNARIVRLLLRYGADPRAVTGSMYCWDLADQGKTAMDFAQHRQRSECMDILKEALESGQRRNAAAGAAHDGAKANPGT